MSSASGTPSKGKDNPVSIEEIQRRQRREAEEVERLNQENVRWVYQLVSESPEREMDLFPEDHYSRKNLFS